MFANERQQLILEQLNQKNSITVSELMDQFHVSTETVRRDLETMEKQFLLKRVHGGAISVQRSIPFEDITKRISANMDLKANLCETALSYLQEGDVIAIDSGSTAATLALAIKKHVFFNLTIVTYSSEVFSILSDCPNIQVIVTGGQYLPKEKVFFGFLANMAVRKFHFNKSFVVPSALSLKHGAQDFIPEVYENQLALIENSNEVFLLADSSKFETSGNLKLCDLLPRYTLITDSSLPDPIYELYRKNKVNLVR